MQTKLRWCKRCDRETPHDIWKEVFPNTGAIERIFFGIGTIGFSELITTKCTECQRCGKIRRKDG